MRKINRTRHVVTTLINRKYTAPFKDSSFQSSAASYPLAGNAIPASQSDPFQRQTGSNGFLDFSDTAKLYNSKSSAELLKSFLVLNSCRVDVLRKLGAQILSYSANPLIATALRHTFFPHFCGGEDMTQARATMKRLSKLNISAILDYAVEGADDGLNAESKFDGVVKILCNTVDFTASCEQGGYACMKMSGIADVSLLERISAILNYHQLHNSPELVPSQLLFPNPLIRTQNFPDQAPAPLSAQEQEALSRVIDRLDTICSKAASLNVPLLIDAEQTWYQGAIDQLVLLMCSRYNKITSTDSNTPTDAQPQRPIIYNTYQLYLKDGLPRLAADIEYARAQGFQLGVKLVRGAYMEAEAERSTELGIPNPIHNTIEDTHNAYNAAVALVLDNISIMGLVAASHNQYTTELVAAELAKRGIASNDPRVSFAQLYGMSDYLSLGLANNGYNVAKYLPFGPVVEVMPYLSRRLQENGSIFGSATYEIERLSTELKRRLLSATQV